MMATLNEQLTELQTARDNIKTAIEGKGQTVTKDIRTYAEAINNIVSGGSTEIPVKLFETTEDMEECTNNKDGDLAIVYSSIMSNSQVDSVFRVAKFPNTVVLPEAYNAFGDQLLYVPADDSGVSMETDGMIYGDSYVLDCTIGDKHISIRYESSDSITYTRTDGGEEIIDFGINIKYDDPDCWNDAMGYFVQIETEKCEGVYKYDGTKNEYVQILS